ncbi:MAG: hypothetical protein KGR98_05505, partial [Verrucomicrobia bacterium]|nr:hypothetical protein [Verrucomicrobiota bacterium]
MKSSIGNCFLAVILVLGAAFTLAAQPTPVTFGTAPPPGSPNVPAGAVFDTLTTALSSSVKPLPVLYAMQRVADWQLAHWNENPRSTTDWVDGSCDAGFMALAGISGDPKYRHAMLTMARSNHWEAGPRQ